MKRKMYAIVDKATKEEVGYYYAMTAAGALEQFALDNDDSNHKFKAVYLPGR